VSGSTVRRRLSPSERRASLLSAAGCEFAEHGYEHASLRAIARRVGVTTPVVYDHFASKADLYAAVAHEAADALLERWAEPPPGDAEEVVRTTLDNIFRWVEEHPHGWRILFADAPSDPGIAATLTALQERATSALTKIFADLPALDRPGSLDPRRADAAYAEAAKSAVNGLAAWWWQP
jgi:AcrR family transcriptional regulator